MARDSKTALQYISDVQKKIIVYRSLGELCDWDQATYMPKQGFLLRAEQKGLVEQCSHALMVSGKLWDTVQHLRKQTLSSRDTNIVNRLHKDLEKARKIPVSLAEEYAKQAALAQQAWESARKQNKFSVFAPYLQRLIELSRKKSACFGVAGHPYNGLLDQFEEGMTEKELQKMFQTLQHPLQQLLATFPKKRFRAIKIPISSQQAACKQLCAWMNLPAEKTRLDVSIHPFSTGMGPCDVRITTAYKEHDPTYSFTSTAHEAGHALYELGLPEEYSYSVIYGAPSLGMHESQSRFWEHQIIKGKPFWRKHYRVYQKITGVTFPLEQWYAYMNRILTSPVRLEADEISYIFHIQLRFEIEKELFEGLDAADVPKRWNYWSEKLLGVVPENDLRGPLQDVHWALGVFGYFPTYALGSVYAAQYFKTLTSQLPIALQHAELSEILEWMRKHVHRYGRMHLASTIMKRATGKSLDTSAFLWYVQEKYGQIHDL